MRYQDLDFNSNLSKRSDGIGYNRTASYSRKNGLNKKMLIGLGLGAAALVIGGAAYSFFKGRDEKKPEIEWVYSYKRAFSMAEELEKPVMIYFHATWCGTCKQMEDTFKDGKVVEKSNEFIPLSLDVDLINLEERLYIEKTFGRIEYIPTIIFATYDEKQLHRFVGYRNPDDFISEMETALYKLHEYSGLFLYPSTINYQFLLNSSDENRD